MQCSNIGAERDNDFIASTKCTIFTETSFLITLKTYIRIVFLTFTAVTSIFFVVWE